MMAAIATPWSNYLVRIYSGSSDLSTLAQLTGLTYPQLDRDYRQFMQSVIPSQGEEKPGK